mmetsp:Transcript_21493/g.60104  ORF Transcript_21493/g.60104 Transcript_21493/m.60104 type:complete len:217 (-) Transcript_21493:1277-1927(-)
MIKTVYKKSFAGFRTSPRRRQSKPLSPRRLIRSTARLPSNRPRRPTTRDTCSRAPPPPTARGWADSLIRAPSPNTSQTGASQSLLAAPALAASRWASFPWKRASSSSAPPLIRLPPPLVRLSSPRPARSGTLTRPSRQRRLSLTSMRPRISRSSSSPTGVASRAAPATCLARSSSLVRTSSITFAPTSTPSSLIFRRTASSAAARGSSLTRRLTRR